MTCRKVQVLNNEKKEMSSSQNIQFYSRKRVVDYGEVFTLQREVKAMLNLVKYETEKIDSRFLEPACGTGNFLVELLNRKLKAVKIMYGDSQQKYEQYAMIAISSIYGIEILEDNVSKCKKRLLEKFQKNYFSHFKKMCDEKYLKSVRFVVNQNIIWGDALAMRTCGDSPSSIVFSEWTQVQKNKIKRREFVYQELLSQEPKKSQTHLLESGESAVIPRPSRVYSVAHRLEVEHAN